MNADKKSKAELLKEKGNAAFENQDYSSAIEFYSQAISLEPSNEKLYSNRSGAYTASLHYVEAESDAYAVIRLSPEWTKGYTRLGSALIGQKRFEDAEYALNIGLHYSPEDQKIKDDIEICKKNGINISPVFFGVPFIFALLRKSQKYSKIFENPSKLKVLRTLQDNPLSTSEFSQDPEIENLIRTSFEFINCDLNFFEKETTTQTNGSILKKLNPDKLADENRKNRLLQSEMPKNSNPAEALRFKEQGNKFFHDKDYGGALLMYSKAINSDPDNQIYYSNRAAAFASLEFHQPAITDSDKAIEIQASYIKPYHRRAQAFYDMGQYVKAYEAYNEALAIEPNNQDSLSGIDMVINKIVEVSKKVMVQYIENSLDPNLMAAANTLRQLNLYDSFVGYQWNFELIKNAIKNPIFRQAFEVYENSFVFQTQNETE